ncbi:hypothetical protein PPROV_000519500 [Pycnococcus provasolii]|uniref:Uncharacterized protein n=1 Tax=Pycnococcus provasolii TaxID=41880 RepID=A0A830HKU5_9CHLO|nr:hypothetical protein PPROV_000519500 [Pycnococcus provasolii]
MAIKTMRASKTKATRVIARTFAERAVDQKARREYRSFEDARAYVHTLGLKSAEEWRAWRASDARPHDIPSNPYHEYASSGWLSYGDFLGYAVGKVTGNFRSFEDARAYVHTLGLKSQKEWKAWRRSGARPHDIPSVPETHYASLGWTSYPDFLGYAVGKEAQFRPRTNFRSLEDARAYVHTLGLKSQKEWHGWSASGARPYDIPGNPETYYASSGWLSYGDFLGYAVGEEARGKQGTFCSFEDARAYVHKLGLMSQKEWRAWSASGARPRDIPSNPDHEYASSGWLSYPDFLGYAVGKEALFRPRTDFRSFEDARAYVHTLGLKSADEWHGWSASRARPYDIPGNPHKYYASSGWLSYGDFLGYAVGEEAQARSRTGFRSFEDARAYVHKLGLMSSKEWEAWSASGARPYDIPSAPHRTYKSSGWLSYPDFLGYAVGKEAQIRPRTNFRSLEDARAYVRTLGLKSAEEWEAWSASGARPYDIPSNPQVTYESSGWLCYGDFLGYKIGNVAGEFRSFEDARTSVRELGLKSKDEWEAWSASGARPYDIPGHPETYYASSGWTSYGDFLGYAVGKEAQVRSRTGFRSFEEARAYVRELGLKSAEEWRAWCASGARPHDIPSDPNTYYASSGWLSYGDFLGFAVGKKAFVRKRNLRT